VGLTQKDVAVQKKRVSLFTATCQGDACAANASTANGFLQFDAGRFNLLSSPLTRVAFDQAAMQVEIAVHGNKGVANPR
jgi:hypothetical protein